MTNSVNQGIKIFDEYLVDFSGHFYEYDKSVINTFKEKQWRVELYGNEKVLKQIETEISCIPSLVNIRDFKKFKSIPILGKLIDRVLFWIIFYRSINKIFNECKLENEWIAFYPNVNWTNILPIILYHQNKTIPAFLLLRTSIFNHIGITRHLTWLVNRIYKFAINQSKINNNIKFVTDSSVVSNEIEQFFKLSVPVMPIPHLNFNLSPKKNELSIDKKIRLYIPGLVRAEKGVEYVLDSLEKMKTVNLELFNRLHLIVQISDRITPYENFVQLRLIQSGISFSNLAMLDSKEYLQAMTDSDIVLITYNPDSGFKYRTSGILSECIVFSKPYITSAHTWMSNISEENSIGSVVRFGDKVQLINSIIDLVANYDDYYTCILNFRPSWESMHSKENFYNIIYSELFNGFVE